MIEGYCTTSTMGRKTISSSISMQRGVPWSAAPGDLVSFHMSADTAYTVTYLRLRSKADVFDGVAMGPSFSQSAHIQKMPPEPWLGCSWQVDFDLWIPASWQSGFYAAHCRGTNGEDYYVVFIVKPFSGLAALPQPGRRSRFAVLACTNTWNAYNTWGGRDFYTDPVARELSFERPSPQTRPAPPYFEVDDPQGRLSVDAYTRSQTRAELWLLTWLEDAGYLFDVFTDADFHVGTFDPADYAGLILNAHPEYWTLAMRDRLDAYLKTGGRLVYLGGNGLYERVEYEPDLSVMVGRRGGATQTERWLFRNQGRPELDVLGVAYNNDSWFQPVTGYRTRQSDHRFLHGTGLVHDAPFGDTGLTGTRATAENGKACGWEMDDQRDGHPLGSVVLAESTGFPAGASTMTCWDRNGGFVYSVGSLIYGGSLVLDPILQKILRNVLDECLRASLPLLAVVESTFFHWLREGILGVGPVGPIPIPPHGAERDVWIGLLAVELANELSSQSARSKLREVGIDLVVQVAQKQPKLRPQTAAVVMP